jgi:RNA polymerase sigma factor (sigma-70 family)
MAHVATGSVVRQLGALFEGGSAAGLSDRQLLERYNDGAREPAGEAAFAALVARHGPMVLGVCRELLGDHQHAEDAFQAVFLVLAGKAHSLRDPDLLGNWLYGVAVRTARCARQQIGRRRRQEEGDAMRGPGASPCAAAGPAAPSADRPALDREQAEALHGEVDRLPRAFRLPVVLCYFEGLTLDEAARRLRCPAGTLRSRLARAREKLRVRLTRRGVVLPAAALGAALAPRSASASIPPLLCDSTTRAAIAFAAQHAAAGASSAPAAALAQEVLRTMLIHKLKLVAMSLLALATLATGAGALTHSLSASARSREGEPPGEPIAQAARTEPRPPDAPRPAPGRMTVAGRVLDPDGKPVKGALVDLIARLRSPWVAASDEINQYALLGQGQSDGEGRYRLDVPRIASNRAYGILALAASPGYGLGSATLNPDAEQPAADVRLQPEQVVRARLVDLTGAPARGVEVRVLGYWRPNDRGTSEGDGAWLGTNPPKGVRAWPRAIIRTDEQGRIALAGIGRGFNITLDVRDMRYARQDLHIDAGKAESSREVNLVLQPARTIEGRVLAADTGRPIPNAIVSASALIRNEHANGIFTEKFRADDQGRFVMNPIAGKIGYMNPDAEGFVVGAFPTGGEPYLIQQDEVPWTKGAVKATHDIRLPRGVLIRGKVAEARTDRPLAGSSIQFIPARRNDKVLSGWQAIVASRDDGTFQIAVPPGKGHLLIFGPTGDYVLGEIGFNALYNNQDVRSTRSGGGGMRYRAHAIIPYEVKAGDPTREVAAALRPGATIKGRVEGPDGQTITDGFILTTLNIEAQNPHWRSDYRVPIRDGRFELHGLDPRGTARVHAFDPEHEWGATVEFAGQQPGEDQIIRLQPCGRATARFVGPDGKPVARHQPNFEFVMTPGPSSMSQREQDRAVLAADADYMANVDRKHYWKLPRTDAQGVFTMGSLIPGALYRINDMSTVNDPNKGTQVRRDFTVKPGETVDLGDILIEDPRWGAQ